MSNEVETPSRSFGRIIGNAAFRSRLLSQESQRQNLQFGTCSDLERSKSSFNGTTNLGHQKSLNVRDLRGNISGIPRLFGTQCRLPSSSTASHMEMRDIDGQIQKSFTSTTSRTLGLIPEDVNGWGEKLNRNRDEPMPKSFGLQSKNLSVQSRFLNEDDPRRIPDGEAGNYRSENLNSSAMSRAFGVGVLRSESFRGGSNADFGGLLSLQSRNMSEGTRNFTRAFGSSVGISQLQIKPTVIECDDGDIQNGGFRRPMLSKVIRGRNSILTSRLFQNHNIDRHSKDLSNINGFNASHISRREMESLSESKLALNVRSNWMDGQSVAGSVLTASSIKAQFVNLLENLHHSILNMGPNLTAEAVRHEFDKAKQGLENMSEISFAPSVRDHDAASVINQTSRFICPAESMLPKETVDGVTLHLKSSKEILSRLTSKAEVPMHQEKNVEMGGAGKLIITSSKSKGSDDEETSQLTFKKPKPYTRRKRNSRTVKMKERERSSLTEAKPKVINLKQWYPVSVGSDLALCGVDEEGTSVQTGAVKKRLNNRKIKLYNGSDCNLIGSPSAMVSVLPQKIKNLLRNGLTDRWKVLQKELTNCQVVEKEQKQRISKSPQKKEHKTEKRNRGRPKIISSPMKRATKSPEEETKRKSKSPKAVRSRKKNDKVAEVVTRSGRSVKPPSMFWMASMPKSDQVTSTLTSPKSTSSKEKLSTAYSDKKIQRSNRKNSKKVAAGISPRKKRKLNESSQSDESSGDVTMNMSEKDEEAALEQPRRKSKEVKSPKVIRMNETEEAKAHSSTNDSEMKKTRGKRKREVAAGTDVVLSKKSRLEKMVSAELFVEKTQPIPKKQKEKRKGIQSPPKPKATKVSSAKNKVVTGRKGMKNNVGSKPEKKKEGKETNELDEDFEMRLDDIEIPEILNASGNPQLSRSQLRLVSMETPPLKYFNSNLKLLRSATPMRSPEWCISQRTESEVKQFQKRRAEAFRKKTKVNLKKTMVMEKTTKSVQSKDLKRVMEWVTEKTVSSPQWNSAVLRYVLPSRKRMEQQDEEEDSEDAELEYS